MKRNAFRFPDGAGLALSMLPPYPGSLLFALTLNAALRNRVPADVQQALEGKRMRIRVEDARITFDFTCKKGRFVAWPGRLAPDLTITASAHDFLSLIRREEDPDTLFFSRRLVMEGDTELGLIVKNTLDAIDLPALDLKQFTPARLFAGFKSRRIFPF